MAFGLVLGGIALLGSAYMQEQGRKKSLRDQAAAEEANALFFAEQQSFVEMQGRRQLSIFDDESNTFIADKVSLIAQAGVDLSGNLLSVLANESAKIAGEHNAILLQNEFKSKLAGMRVASSEFNASNLRNSADDKSSFYGSLLGVGAQTALASYGGFSNTDPGGLKKAAVGTARVSSGAGGAGIGSGSLPSGFNPWE